MQRQRRRRHIPLVPLQTLAPDGATTKEKPMLFDLMRRLNAVAGSVVTLATALAVAVNLFVAEVAPELPSGYQDNTTRIGAAVVSVLLAAAAAVRRVTEVPMQARGLTMPEGSSLTVEVSHPGGKSAITSAG